MITMISFSSCESDDSGFEHFVICMVRLVGDMISTDMENPLYSYINIHLKA